ncbi:MAG: caspase family protein [Bacteroidales bacterium]|nr:caspase family protein [Candidatus Colimorpha merdihippi]
MKQRLAICIGNDEYEKLEPLKGAVKDSINVKNVLESLSFEVLIHNNLKLSEMGAAIGDFVCKINNESTEAIVIYFAGHGMEMKGETLMLPVDFDRHETPIGAINQSFTLELLLDQLQEYPDVVKIIIFDACRTSLERSRGTDGRYTSIKAPRNTIIAFGTSPGERAEENNGGIYTRALIEYLPLQREPIETIFKKVRQSLVNDNHLQIPWEHSSLIQDFQLNPGIYYEDIAYNENALADKDFSTLNLTAKKIIDDLKSYNWYIQKDAITRLQNSDLTSFSADELFVMGRNICQAAEGDCIACQSFISNFKYCNLVLIKEKCHLLNGIAYEIFFDKNNALRKSFKASHYSRVISALEAKDFLSCGRYISSTLKCQPKRIIYLPYIFDRKFALDFKVIFEAKYTNQSLLEISSLKLNGCDLQVEAAVDNSSYNHHKVTSIDEAKEIVKNIIAESIVAPTSEVSISFDDVNELIDKIILARKGGYVISKIC